MSARKQRPVGSAYASLSTLVVALTFLEIPTAMAQTADEEKNSLSFSVIVTGRDSNTRVDGYVRFAKKDRCHS